MLNIRCSDVTDSDFHMAMVLSESHLKSSLTSLFPVASLLIDGNWPQLLNFPVQLKKYYLKL